MFGDRIVLMQEAGTETAPGKPAPTKPAKVEPKYSPAEQSLRKAIAPLATKIPTLFGEHGKTGVQLITPTTRAITGDEGAADPATEEVGVQATDTSSSGFAMRNQSDIFKDTVLPGGAKANAFLVGQSSPALPDAMAEKLERHKAAIHAGNYAKGLANLQAGYVQEEVISQFADIAVADHAAIRDLVQNEFPKFRQKQQELQDELDDIRARKVNPYSYYQQAGAGGRAALSLATAVGQLAAGAGHINAAQATVKAAIERDISAQMTNIDNAYKGVAASSENIAAQIALIETEISFRERARAVAFEAAGAVIDEAMQKAANEAAYINLKLFNDYIGLEAIQAFSDYLAKTATIHYKMPVSNYHTALKRAGQVGEFQQALKVAFTKGQQASGLQQAEAAAMNAGEPSGQGTGIAQTPGTGQARTPGTPSGSTRAPRPAVATDRPTIGPGTPEQQVPDLLAREPEAEKAERLKDDSIANTMNIVNENVQRIADPKQRYLREKHGSHAGAIASAHGVTQDFPPSVLKSIETLEEDESGYFTQENPGKARTQNDADAIAGHWKRTRDLSIPTNRYIATHPELFESDSMIDLGKAGNERTTINSVALGQLHIKRGTSARVSEKKYDEIVTELAGVEKTMSKYKQAYDALEKTSIGSFWGVSVHDGQVAWAPKSTPHSQGMQMVQRLMTEVGIELIKTLDPAGRLSDQDVTLAKGMISWANDNKWATFINAFDNYTNPDGSPGDIQQGIMNTLRYFANARLEAFVGQYRNPLILPPTLHFSVQNEEDSVRAWMNEEDKK